MTQHWCCQRKKPSNILSPLPNSRTGNQGGKNLLVIIPLVNQSTIPSKHSWCHRQGLPDFFHNHPQHSRGSNVSDTMDALVRWASLMMPASTQLSPQCSEGKHSVRKEVIVKQRLLKEIHSWSGVRGPCDPRHLQRHQSPSYKRVNAQSDQLQMSVEKGVFVQAKSSSFPEKHPSRSQSAVTAAIQQPLCSL